MARKSLVLNGFLGGINQDGDASDLESEDSQGRNQLAICNDALCNQPGKIRAERPDVVTGSGDITVQGTPQSTDDFLIHGSKWYRHKGVYKLGEEIEYSRDAATAAGSTTINRPVAVAAGRIAATSSRLANSIGLDTDGTSSGDDLNRVFLGKTASTNTAGNAIYADGALHASAGTVPTPGKMIRFANDGDNDEKFEQDEFDDFTQMGYFHDASDWTVGLWDDSGSDPTSGSGTYGWSNIGSGALVDNQWQVTGDRDLSEADFIRFGRNASDASENKDIGVVFRVGDMVYDGARPDGMFGGDFNITDKDIYIEIDFNSSTDGTFDVGEFWNGFTTLNITAESQGTDATIHYSDSDYDSYAKTWEVSKADLINYGCESAQKDGSSSYVTGASGGGRFKIPWSSAIHTGGNFSSANIKSIAVVLIGGDMEAPAQTDPLTVWVARLYELSFQSAGSIGWANTVTQFSQSRIYESTAGNKVESLLQPYGNYLDLVADNTLNLKFYQPTTVGYEGRIYYQDCDDTGTPLGSAFLIADVSYDKGVKSILSEFYENWSSNTVSFNFSDPPVGSTHQLESGYTQETETVNAIWKHAAVVGRQVYIGNVIKTGDDLTVTDAKSGGSSVTQDLFPKIDSTRLTATVGAIYRFKILSGGQTFTVSANGGDSYVGTFSIAAAGAYLDTVAGIYISFPTDEGYATDDEWEFVTTADQDLILKSAIGKRYGFPDTQYVDLELPGTGITAMYAVGDRLFCFSSSTLTIVNVAQDYEYLEGTFMGKGIASPKQAVEVEEGIAFVNGTGVYYFDGSRMESLSDDLMMTFDWSTATSIGYLPDEKLVCVWHTTSTGILTYSLATKAWVGNSLSNVTPTTRVKFYENEPHWIESTTLKKLSIVNTASVTTVDIKTGNISCGDLSRYKKFVKALVTCDNTNLNILYSIDGETLGYSENSIDGTKDISIGKKGKTIQFQITSDVGVNGGQVSDITLVYRDLRID